MRRSPILRVLGAAVLLVLLSTSPSLSVHAQEMASGTAAMFIIGRAMPGHEAPFENGVREYLDWAASAGDDWTWAAFQVMSGDDTGGYMWVSVNHAWSDFDNPPLDQAESNAQMAEKIAPHAGPAVHRYTNVRTDLSVYSRTGPAPMYQVVEYHVSPTGRAAFENGFAQFRKAVQETGADVEYVIHELVSGGAEGTYWLAIPMDSYAELEPGNPMAIMAEAFGQTAAMQLGDAWSESIRYAESTLYVLRPDLSMNLPEE